MKRMLILDAAVIAGEVERRVGTSSRERGM